MSKWTYFLWLSRQALDGLLYMWPITAALSGLVVVGVLRSRSKAPAKPRGSWWLQGTPLLVPIGVLVLGAVYACENCSPTSLGQGVRHVWALYAANALLLLHLVGAVWLVTVAPGARLLSLGLQSMFLWCSLWAAFLAGMSLSGDWL